MAQRCGRNLPSAQVERSKTLKRDWLAVVNPRSGGNRNRTRLSELLVGLERLADRTVLTCYPGHAAELAMESQAYEGVVAVGGDGTLFEILKGIDCTKQRIAVIPAGRGNSLARDLGLMNRHGRLDSIHWEKARSIDLMDVKVTTVDGAEASHFSASTVAIGYPAAVARGARQLAWMGRASYAAAATIARTEFFSARIQTEGGCARELRLSGFIANNTRHLANFLAFRGGDCSDGLFEIMEMNAGRAKQTAHNLSALSRMGVYEPYPPKQVRSAEVCLETPQDLMIDGEILHDVISFNIGILPSALVCNGPRTQCRTQ
jgi:diacylglycerol kinase (ATP)